MSEISTQPLTPEIMDEMSLADLESALAEGRITTKALAKAMMDRMFFLKGTGLDEQGQQYWAGKIGDPEARMVHVENIIDNLQDERAQEGRNPGRMNLEERWTKLLALLVSED